MEQVCVYNYYITLQHLFCVVDVLVGFFTALMLGMKEQPCAC